MADRIFPRWCASLFALLPLCEVLYLPAGPQSLYAAALACALAGLLSAGAASRGLTAGGAVLALLSQRSVLLLGEHTAALLPYPNFSAAGLAALGNFARHGEVFFAVPLILCETGRCAALLCVILRILPRRQTDG